MGKRARKTRWRALDIADDHSDSEESKTNSSVQSARYSRSYRSSLHHSKYSYSSQSTPARRRYQYDGSTKTTRSSSTTSENKITFNEDEYTRITTPRQDVLFKKGYLNKPRSYQSQTSTGNSTISTGYSTENGTPDHQSTDLDYESQFVFPNGFVDTNGIYYVNSYEPYPFMFLNPPTYYHECSNVKSKRYSTGSLSESMSPNNEESASQDLSQSGGEASNSVSDYSSGAPVYNMVFPGYYVNGTSALNDLTNGHHGTEPVKKLKKRRERKSSKTVPGDSTENTDNSSDEEDSPKLCILPAPENSTETTTGPASKPDVPVQEPQHQNNEEVPPETKTDNAANDSKEEKKTATPNIISCDKPLTDGCAESKTENIEVTDTEQAHPTTETDKQSLKPSVLKPDAEEFVPRIYQPLAPPPSHIKMLPPNFVPIPLVSINDFGGPNFNPHAAFIPPGFPINFIPHHPGQKVFPPVQGFVNFAPPPVQEATVEENIDQIESQPANEEKEKGSTATPSHTPVIEDAKPSTHNKVLDIATVVSKLEEAAKQQEKNEIHKDNSSQTISNKTNFIRESPKFTKMPPPKKNYIKYRNSSARNGIAFVQKQNIESNSSPNVPSQARPSPEFQKSTSPPVNESNGTVEQEKVPPNTYNNISRFKPSIEVSDKTYINKLKHSNKIDDSRIVRNSPERFRKIWKPNGYQNNYQNGYSSPKRQQNGPYIPHHNKYTNNGSDKRYTNGELNSPNKNYSEMVRKEPSTINNSQPQSNLVEKTNNVIEPVKDGIEKAKQTKPKLNQWISVSNRKKKKNKGLEENGFETDEETSYDNTNNETAEVFENYDVTQLVDVIPPSKEPEEQVQKNIGDILLTISQTESSEGQETPINIPKVSEIEKNIIVKIEEEKTANEDAIVQLESTKKELEPPVNIPKEESPKETERENENFKPKKSKKGTQKPLTKKVIITDIDLSMSVEEVKSPVKKIVKKIDECKSPAIITNNDLSDNQLSNNEINDIAVNETVTDSTEPGEKKTKKKKKKAVKLPLITNLSSSTVNLNSPDDSYDFLLEKGLLNETLEKTNDELSLELDKIIQKGIYSSLQEKIKSINEETTTDGFFKALDAVVSPAKDNISGGNGFMKAPDFNRIFQSTRQFLKPNMVSVEPDISDIKVADDETDNKNTSFDPGAANSSAGPVLEHCQLVQEVEPTAVDDPGTPTIDDDDDYKEEGKKLYPITQAVKDWMSRTRETTPEIEILKSPSTIKREFGNNVNFEEGTDTSDDFDEEEITLFSTTETHDQEQPDLLEYWEDELKDEPASQLGESMFVHENKLFSNGRECSKCQKGNLKCGDEEIEVYESKYGENDAFLKLHKELNEMGKDASRTGSLPYRAVCCSLQ